MRSTLTVIGVTLITVFAAPAYGRLLALGVLIAGSGVVFQNTQTMLAVPLMAGLRLGRVSALDLTRQLIIAGLIVILVVAGAQLLPFLAVSAVAAVVSCAHPHGGAGDGQDSLAAVVRATGVACDAGARSRLLGRRGRWRLVLPCRHRARIAYYGIPSARLLQPLLSHRGSPVPTSGIVAGSAFPIFARAA
jgi:hypothetical protein